MGNSVSNRRSKYRTNNGEPLSTTQPGPPPTTKTPSVGQSPNLPKLPKMKATAPPYPKADSTLRALASQAEGFGRSAIGGLHGALYHVTTLADDGPGSLRDGCRRKEPLWIVFDLSGTVELRSIMNVNSFKTIDGRGQRIKITDKGIRLQKCEHVIICNLEFEGGKGSDVDAIQIKPHSKHVWIDRCSLSNYADGLVDITRESTDITISRCRFSQHNKTILIGADPSHVGDKRIRVTIHHCFFDGTVQRHPRVRFAKVHLYNNYTRNWGIYAVCASVKSQIFSECNIYEAGEKSVSFLYYKEKAGCEEECTGYLHSEGDWFVGNTKSGLGIGQCGESGGSFHPGDFYGDWTVEAPTEVLKQYLQHSTGWQSLPLPPDNQ